MCVGLSAPVCAVCVCLCVYLSERVRAHWCVCAPLHMSVLVWVFVMCPVCMSAYGWVCVCLGVCVCLCEIGQQAGMSSDSGRHFPGRKAVCPESVNVGRTELNGHLARCTVISLDTKVL